METVGSAAITKPPASGVEALAELKARYLDRRGALVAAMSAGSRIVGCIGNVIPLEMILAAGFEPIQVAAELGHETPVGDEFMEESNSWDWRSIFERVLDGTFDPVELLVIDRDHHELFYYLKEVVRIGKGRTIAPLYIFDLIQDLESPVQNFNRGRIVDFADRLERLSGAVIADDALAAAISRTNRRRSLQREVLALRYSGALSGVDALQILGAAYLMATDAYVAALEVLVADPPQPASGEQRPRIAVLSSERIYHTALHEVLEEAGALVTAEGDWWGSASVGGDIKTDGPPLEAIAAKYYSDTVSPELLPRAARDRWILDEVHGAHRPDAVVFYMPPSDTSYGWDYPHLRDALAELKIETLVIRDDVLNLEGRAAIASAVQAFVTGLAPAGTPAAER